MEMDHLITNASWLAGEWCLRLSVTGIPDRLSVAMKGVY